jgi:hypothetical protein
MLSRVPSVSKASTGSHCRISGRGRYPILGRVRVVGRLHVKTKCQITLLLRSLFTAENGAFESDGRPQSTNCQSHCSHVSVLSSKSPLCTNMIWVEHAKGKKSQPSRAEYFFVHIRRSSYKSLSHLGEFVFTTICRSLMKSASNSYVTT